MAQQRLFELIREEDVVLFVGAGFSLYAGYPTGAKLAKIIFDQLSSTEKTEIAFTSNLPELCEDIYNLKGNKNFLIRCLKDVFGTKPKNIEVHQKLSNIPHFKSIITTNYDRLFEESYNAIEVIHQNKDLPLTNFVETHLYKIHGDLHNPDQIILLQSDYEKYFIDQEQTFFWNAVKNELVKKHILFIGYSLDDINIKTIIRKINKELGNLRKEAFFIAPNANKSKRNYLSSQNIVYINSTGERFIQELIQDLNQKYLPQVQITGGSMDTVSKFGQLRNLKFDLAKRLDKNGISITNIKLIDPSKPVPLKIQLATKLKSKINDLFSGKTESATLLSNELEDFAVSWGSIHLQDKNSIESIILKRLPNYDGKIIFVFDDGYESSEFHLRIQSSKADENRKKVELEFFGFQKELNLEILPDKSITINSSIKPKTPLASVRDGIEFYEIMTRIMSGIQFTAFKNNEKKYRHGDNWQLNMTEGNFEDMLVHFKNLKKIEQFFKIRFTNLELEGKDFSKVENIMAFIRKEFIADKFDNFKIQKEEDAVNVIKDEKDDFLLLSAVNERTVYNLYNHKIDIGFPFILIPDAFIEKSNKDEDDNQITIKSRSKKLYRGFSNDQEVKIEEYQVEIIE